MGVHGIGGIFFKAQNPKELAQWYERHLGVVSGDGGATFGWRRLDTGGVGGTVWAPFSADTEYFAPSESSWMVNFRVDDLDAVIAALTAAGAQVVGDVEEFSYGRFGWVLDPENNKIELWQPLGDEFPSTVPAPSDQGLDGVWLAPPGTTIAATDAASDRAITAERTVALPIATVWRLWTTTAGMAEWLVDDSRIELRVGGPMELYFLDQEPPGSRGSDNCRILSYLPHRMLSFTWNAPPHLAHTRPRHTHVVVEFADLDGAQTHVTLTHLGWPGGDDHPQWTDTFTYFETAWPRMLDALEAHANRA